MSAEKNEDGFESKEDQTNQGSDILQCIQDILNQPAALASHFTPQLLSAPVDMLPSDGDWIALADYKPDWEAIIKKQIETPVLRSSDEVKVEAKQTLRQFMASIIPDRSASFLDCPSTNVLHMLADVNEFPYLEERLKLLPPSEREITFRIQEIRNASNEQLINLSKWLEHIIILNIEGVEKKDCLAVKDLEKKDNSVTELLTQLILVRAAYRILDEMHQPRIPEGVNYLVTSYVYDGRIPLGNYGRFFGEAERAEVVHFADQVAANTLG